MEPALSVVIPTRNRRAILQRTLDGYLRHEAQVPFEVVVADDGSDDATVEYLASASAREPRLRVVRQAHAGPAQARNRAIAEARGRYLLLAGDDVRPAEGLVDGHVAAHEGKDSPGPVLGRIDWDPERLVTPVMKHISGLGGQQFRYPYLREGQRLGFKYFYGSNLSFRRGDIEALTGPFDPAFGDAALEDVDLGYRMMGFRREIEYRPRLLAWHDHPYDVAGFANRQYRVGRSTPILFARHPEIESDFGGDLVATAIGIATSLISRGGAAVSPADVAGAEGRLLASLASAEHRSSRWQGRVYLGVFWYFQAKGMVESQVEAAVAAPALAVLMSRALTCALRGLLRDPTCGLTSEARADLAQLCAWLERNRVVVGQFGSCLRWWLEVRLREVRYALRPRS